MLGHGAAAVVFGLVAGALLTGRRLNMLLKVHYCCFIPKHWRDESHDLQKLCDSSVL